MERHGWKYITLAAAALLDGEGKKAEKPQQSGAGVGGASSSEREWESLDFSFYIGKKPLYCNTAVIKIMK
jgi:hypothetical protein